MKDELNKPEALNTEIILDPTREIMSKTDGDGIIEFVNDYFVEVSGYEEYELLGKTMHCTQHPDMPSIIFKMMWERLINKQNFNVLIKNLAKDGRYYWAISDFSFKEDENGKVIAIYNRRKIASPHVIRYFDALYKKLKNIEDESGYVYAEKYLIGHEEEKGKNIEELLYDLQSDLNVHKKVNKPVNPVVESPKLEKVKPIKQEETILDLTLNKEPEPVQEKSSKELSIKERLALLKEIHEKTLKAIDVKPVKSVDFVEKELPLDKTSNSVANKQKENINLEPETKKKKGLFQKLFGKTEEELEEERRRKGEI